MKKVIWYSVVNGGDGSAYPVWMESEELCRIDQKFMSEGWGEPCTGSLTIESDSEIYIDEGIKTAAEVKEELEEELGEDYMVEYMEKGEYSEDIKRLEGYLAAVKELIERGTQNE